MFIDDNVCYYQLLTYQCIFQLFQLETLILAPLPLLAKQIHSLDLLPKKKKKLVNNGIDYIFVLIN